MRAFIHVCMYACNVRVHVCMYVRMRACNVCVDACHIFVYVLMSYVCVHVCMQANVMQCMYVMCVRVNLFLSLSLFLHIYMGVCVMCGIHACMRAMYVCGCIL